MKEKEEKRKQSGLISLKEIKTLVEMLAENNIREFSLSQNGLIIKIIRGLISVEYRQPHVPTVQIPLVAVTPAVQPSIQEPEKVREENLVEVKSEHIGITHLSPAPNQPPFVKEGQTVKKDDVLCRVDTRIKSELEVVKSPCSGTVKKIRIQEDEVIDYSTILFTIRSEELQEEKSEPGKTPVT